MNEIARPTAVTCLSVVGYFFDAETPAVIIGQGYTLHAYMLDNEADEKYYHAAIVHCDCLVDALIVVPSYGGSAQDAAKNHIIVVSSRHRKWQQLTLALPTGGAASSSPGIELMKLRVNVVTSGIFPRKEHDDIDTVLYTTHTDSTGTYTAVTLSVGVITLIRRTSKGISTAKDYALLTPTDEACALSWMQARDFTGSVMLGVLYKRVHVPLDPPLLHFTTLCLDSNPGGSSTLMVGPWGIDNVDSLARCLLTLPVGLVCVPSGPTVDVYSQGRGLECSAPLPAPPTGIVSLSKKQFLLSLEDGSIAFVTITAESVEEGFKSRRQGTYFQLDVIIKKDTVTALPPIHTLVVHPIHSGRLWRVIGLSRSPRSQVVMLDVSAAGEILVHSGNVIQDWGAPFSLCSTDVDRTICSFHPKSCSIARHSFGHMLDTIDEGANTLLRGHARVFGYGEQHLLLSYTQSYESCLISLLTNEVEEIDLIDTATLTLHAYKSSSGMAVQVTPREVRVGDPTGKKRVRDVNMHNTGGHVFTHAFATSQHVGVIVDRTALLVLPMVNLTAEVRPRVYQHPAVDLHVNFGKVCIALESTPQCDFFRIGQEDIQSQRIALEAPCHRCLIVAEEKVLCGLTNGAYSIYDDSSKSVVATFRIGTAPVSLFHFRDSFLMTSGVHASVWNGSSALPCYMGNNTFQVINVAKVAKRHYAVVRSEATSSLTLSLVDLSPRASWHSQRLSMGALDVSHAVYLRPHHALVVINQRSTTLLLICCRTHNVLHRQDVPSPAEGGTLHVMSLEPDASCGFLLVADSQACGKSFVSRWELIKENDQYLFECTDVTAYTDFIERAVTNKKGEVCLQLGYGGQHVAVNDRLIPDLIGATLCPHSGFVVGWDRWGEGGVKVPVPGLWSHAVFVSATQHLVLVSNGLPLELLVVSLAVPTAPVVKLRLPLDSPVVALHVCAWDRRDEVAFSTLHGGTYFVATGPGATYATEKVAVEDIRMKD